MAHCRSPTKCLKNGHFPSNQIQIVLDSNCCKLHMDNGLPAGTNFSPDTSDTYIRTGESTLGQTSSFSKIIGEEPRIGRLILKELDAMLSENSDRKSTRLNSSHITISYA